MFSIITQYKKEDFHGQPPAQKSGYFYLAVLYDKKTHSRFLKVGSATNLSERFSPNHKVGQCYRFHQNHDYSSVRLLVSIHCPIVTARALENEAREVLKRQKYLVHVPLDRFKYFLLPLKIDLKDLTFVLKKTENGEAYSVLVK